MKRKGKAMGHRRSNSL